MTVSEAILARRSIRRFKTTPVPPDVIEKVLAVAIQAPSGKNRQPWRFVVLQGASKTKMLQLMAEGMEERRERGIALGSAEYSHAIMCQAPAVVLVFNAEATIEHEAPYRYQWLVDVQSIGGAIQTMLLAAEELGLGSLWVCDIFQADKRIQEWLGRSDELIAAVALGHKYEAPEARPRKSVAEVAEWRD